MKDISRPRSTIFGPTYFVSKKLGEKRELFKEISVLILPSLVFEESVRPFFGIARFLFKILQFFFEIRQLIHEVLKGLFEIVWYFWKVWWFEWWETWRDTNQMKNWLFGEGLWMIEKRRKSGNPQTLVSFGKNRWRIRRGRGSENSRTLIIERRWIFGKRRRSWNF